jgi:hypothetical protein
MKTNQKRVRTAELITEYRRQAVERLRTQGDILEGVTLMAIPKACSICRSDHGRFFKLDEIPVTAHPGCDCENDCACGYLPVLKS